MHSTSNLVNNVGTAMQQQPQCETALNGRNEGKVLKPSTSVTTRLETVYQFCMTNLKPVLMEYWPEFVNKYPELDMQQWAIREYAKQMVDEGISNSKQIQCGITKACKEKFRPRPTEFAKLCKPTAEELGLPSLREAMDEVIARKGKYKNQDFTFSHRIVELICERIGYRVYRMRDHEFTELFKGEYDYWIGRYMSGDLPAAHKALEYTPPTKAKIDSYVANHGLPMLGNDTLSQKIRELGIAVKHKRQEHISTHEQKAV